MNTTETINLNEIFDDPILYGWVTPPLEDRVNAFAIRVVQEIGATLAIAMRANKAARRLPRACISGSRQ